MHELEKDKVINDLANNYFYHRHTFCNVCDTCIFYKMDGSKREFEIDYHRGLLKTSIKFGNIIEVNDLILLQNGKFCYDWDGSNDGISELLELLELEKGSN